MTEMTRMDFVASVQARIGWKALTASEYQDEGFAFLSTPNIKTRDIDFTNVNYISRFRYEESPALKLQVGDVLLAKDGSTLGIANTVRSLPRPATVNGSIAVIRPHRVEPRFLTYWLQGSTIQSQIQQLKDGMGVPHLFQADIRRLPVPALAAAEQRRIADFLDDQVARIDQIITARRQQATLAEATRLEKARVLTTRGRSVDTRASGIAWMPVIGSDFNLWRVGQAFTTGSGTTPRSDNLDYYDGDIPWATTSDLRDGLSVVPPRTVTQIALDEHPALALYPAGTLLVAMYGATVGRAGILAVNSTVNQACCALISRGIISAKYAFYWLFAHRSEIMTLASGGGQPNISQDIVRALRVPAPDWKEQLGLVAALDEGAQEAANARTSLNKSVQLLAEYKQSLITAAVTGEIDVTTAGSGIQG